MRDESTARPAPRLKSSGPDMKASFPVHERTVNSLRVILGWFGAWRLRRRRIVRGLDHQLRSRRGAESASPFTAVRAGRIYVVVPKIHAKVPRGTFSPVVAAPCGRNPERMPSSPCYPSV